jgi:hypothetical protein
VLNDLQAADVVEWRLSEMVEESIVRSEHLEPYRWVYGTRDRQA